MNSLFRLRRPFNRAEQAGGESPGGGANLRCRVAAGRGVVELDETAIGGRHGVTFVVRGIVVERIDPEQLLRDLAFDGPVVLPSCLQAQTTDRGLAITLELHMPEGRRDRLGRRGAVGKLGQPDQHVDEQVFGLAVVGIVVRADVQVRALNGTLRARDAEQLGKTVEERGFPRRVRSDDGGDLGGDGDRDRVGPEAAEAGQGDAFETHNFPLS